MKPETLALASAVFAGLSGIGSVAAAVVSNLNGKRQQESAREIARMNLITPMREAWIAQLRDKISDYLAECLFKFHGAAPEGYQSRMPKLRYEILLMLNPAEGEHVVLDKAISQLMNVIVAKPKDDEKFTKCADSVRSLAHLVLKSEWSKISKKEADTKARLAQVTPEMLAEWETKKEHESK